MIGAGQGIGLKLGLYLGLDLELDPRLGLRLGLSLAFQIGINFIINHGVRFMLTDEQKKTRINGIGGSDMPVILGLSSYKTPYQLYLEKTGQIESGDDMTDHQYWGHKLEGIIRDEFSQRNKVVVKTLDTVFHPINNFLFANVDGFVPEWNAVVEVKCSSGFMAHQWGEDGSDAIPLPYLVQVAHYCHVLNANNAYIAVLIGGNEYKEFIYKRDVFLEERLTEKAIKFWECVKNKTPPEPINQLDLNLMYPKHDPGKCVIINNDISEQLSLLRNIRLKIKMLSQEESSHRFNIMKFMNSNEALMDGFNNIHATWKTNKKGSRTFLVKGE